MSVSQDFDQDGSYIAMMPCKTEKWLIYGKDSWLASYFVPYVPAYIEVVWGKYRCNDATAVQQELEDIRPNCVISFIGRTSGKLPGEKRNVDYLEDDDKLDENLRDNLYSPAVLMILCERLKIHYTYIGTGCIYTYTDDRHPDCLSEWEEPNYIGSKYSLVKGYTSRICKLFCSTTLEVRIRMPISPKSEEKNLISKLLKYQHSVYSTLNSVTVLHTCFPVLVKYIQARRTGPINLTNPEPLTHNDILELYRQYIDKDFNWTNIDEDQHNKLVIAKRSKVVLNSTPVIDGYQLATTKEAITDIFLNYW